MRNEEQRVHELLCAHVLGELDAPERANDREEIERLLAGSEDLRAERARVAATVGLVQGSLGTGEALSSERAERLLAAAERRAAPAPRPVARPVAWHRRPALRLAAAFAFVALGAFAWRSTWDRPAVGDPHGRKLDGLETAAVQRDEAVDGKREANRQDSLRALGYLDDEAERAPAAAAEPREKLAKAEQLRQQGAQRAGETSQSAGLVRFDADSRADAPASRSSEAKNLVAGAEVQLLEELGYVEEDLTSHYDEPSAPPEGATVVRLDPAAQPPPAKGATYRGAGDSVPPGGGARTRLGLPAPSSAGPSSPGPGAVGKAGAASPDLTGSDDFFLGEGERAKEVARVQGEDLSFGLPQMEAPARVAGREPDEERLGRRLRELGYLGGNEESELPAEPAGEPESEAAARGRLEREYRFRYDEDDARDRPRVDVDALLRRIREHCQRRPGERPRDMFFRFWGDNAFVYAHQDPLATLSVDVDTASYALARNYLRRGLLPEKAQVRTEEFVNYFRPDVPAPLEDTFAIHADLAPSLFGPTPDHWMLRVVVRGKDVARHERRPLALTIVLDVSGSMKEENRMELVKHGVRLLLSELDGRDTVAIVAFSNEARLVLPATSAASRGVIEAALFGLRPEGGTNAEAGLKLGYELAAAGLAAGATNRVVLFSDGVANVGQTDQDRIAADVARHTARGIYLNTIGVGMNNHNDVFLEQMADRGEGLCNYVDTPLEAQRALVDNFLGAFEPIARDVKLQVELDPAQVLRYRQLGYENRHVADRDFRNDAVDAGEVGSGHQVVALFEIERRAGADPAAPLATVRLRWKPPFGSQGATAETETAREIERAVLAREGQGGFHQTAPGYRRAVLVAQFAEVLRRSVHARGDSFELLVREGEALERELADPDFTELVDLTKQARDRLLERDASHDELERALDAYREGCWRRADLEDRLEDRAEDRERLAELERENAELLRRLRELLEERHHPR